MLFTRRRRQTLRTAFSARSTFIRRLNSASKRPSCLRRQVCSFELLILMRTMFSSRLASYLGWTNLFTDSLHSFSLGFALLMVIFDVCLMTLFALYVDAVWPTDDSPHRHPLFPFGYHAKSKMQFELDHDETDAPDPNIQTDSTTNYDEADIDVRRISKLWEQTNALAIDNMSFRAYRGQVGSFQVVRSHCFNFFSLFRSPCFWAKMALENRQHSPLFPALRVRRARAQIIRS